MTKWFDIVALERILSKVNGSVSFTVEFDSTYHVDGDRKYRHEGTVIEDKQIIATCQKALKAVVSDLFRHRITMKDELCIQDKSNKLNVICQIRGEGLDSLKLVIITVMIKKDFKVNPGTLIYPV